jgi:hypothetical protein
VSGASRAIKGAENRDFARRTRTGAADLAIRGWRKCRARLRDTKGSDQSSGKIGIPVKYSQDFLSSALAKCCRLIENPTSMRVADGFSLLNRPPHLLLCSTWRGRVRTPCPCRGARGGGCHSDNTPTSERRDSVARPKNTPIGDPADRYKQLTHFTGSCDSRL